MFWIAIIVAAIIAYALYSWAESSDAKDEARRNEAREIAQAKESKESEQKRKRNAPAGAASGSQTERRHTEQQPEYEYKHEYNVPNPTGPIKIAASETPDKDAVVLFGNVRRKIYVYDDRPLKDLPKDMAIFVTICGHDIAMRSITTGTVWDSGENGDIPVAYKGKPIGFVNFDKVPGLKEAAARHKIQIRAIWPGGMVSGVKRLVVLAPSNTSMNETVKSLD